MLCYICVFLVTPFPAAPTDLNTVTMQSGLSDELSEWMLTFLKIENSIHPDSQTYLAIESDKGHHLISSFKASFDIYDISTTLVDRYGQMVSCKFLVGLVVDTGRQCMSGSHKRASSAYTALLSLWHYRGVLGGHSWLLAPPLLATCLKLQNFKSL